MFAGRQVHGFSESIKNQVSKVEVKESFVVRRRFCDWYFEKIVLG